MNPIRTGYTLQYYRQFLEVQTQESRLQACLIKSCPLRRCRLTPVFLGEGNTDLIKLGVFLAAPLDCAWFRVVPDMSAVDLQLQALLKRRIGVETHPWLAEIKARSIFNNDLVFSMICKDNRDGEEGPFMFSGVSVYLFHYSTYIIVNFFNYDKCPGFRELSLLM